MGNSDHGTIYMRVGGRWGTPTMALHIRLQHLHSREHDDRTSGRVRCAQCYSCGGGGFL